MIDAGEQGPRHSWFQVFSKNNKTSGGKRFKLGFNPDPSNRLPSPGRRETQQGSQWAEFISCGQPDEWLWSKLLPLGRKGLQAPDIPKPQLIRLGGARKEHHCQKAGENAEARYFLILIFAISIHVPV